jgi:hypothetical protein
MAMTLGPPVPVLAEGVVGGAKRDRLAEKGLSWALINPSRLTRQAERRAGQLLKEIEKAKGAPGPLDRREGSKPVCACVRLRTLDIG